MILITGGAGYIGSQTALKFIEHDKDIVIFDNLENGHIETINLLTKYKNPHFLQGDLRNINDIELLFNSYKIDTVIHFAAYALVEESMNNPNKYYTNNVLGSINLLETMRKHNVNKIIFSSSCATYGIPNSTPIDETHIQNPINPYGKSKLMVESILKDYDSIFGIKHIILRYFNVAGADSKLRVGEWHSPETHLIPNIIKSIINSSKTFQIFGNNYKTKDGTCIRDYVNVEDLAEAHWLAYKYLLKENTSNTFNLGTENGVSIFDILKCCNKIIGKTIPYNILPARPGDPPILYANSQKAKKVLRWHPQKTLEDSITSAYQWEITRNNYK